MSIIDFLKKIFSGPEKITPEYLEQQRLKLIPVERYIKWLRNRLGIEKAKMIEREEIGYTVDQKNIDCIKLLEDEIEKFKKVGN